MLSVLSEALPIDAQRFTECAFWMAFWGQVSADPKLKRLNAWVHREYMRLFARCFARILAGVETRTTDVRDQVLRSVVTCINGLTASAVTSPRDWPAHRQIEHLDLQLDAPATAGRRPIATTRRLARGARGLNSRENVPWISP